MANEKLPSELEPRNKVERTVERMVERYKAMTINDLDIATRALADALLLSRKYNEWAMNSVNDPTLSEMLDDYSSKIFYDIALPLEHFAEDSSKGTPFEQYIDGLFRLLSPYRTLK